LCVGGPCQGWSRTGRNDSNGQQDSVHATIL
jgi:hypothetical protein